MTLKQEVQRLVADARTEQALALLAEHSSDALLLQARYNNGKKQYHMGLIEFTEWQRTQAQLNYAVMELADTIRQQPIVVHTHQSVNVYYIVPQEMPANNLAKFNRIFDGLKRMIQDRNYPLNEIQLAVGFLDEIFGEKLYVDELEKFQLRAYATNTDAYKTEQRRILVELLLSHEEELLIAIDTVVEQEQKTTPWKEAWNLFTKDPTHDRWTHIRDMFEKRLADKTLLFKAGQKKEFAVLADAIDAVPVSPLWKIKTRTFIQRLQDWLVENMK